MLQYLLLQNKTMFMHVHVFYVNKLDEEYKAKGFFKITNEDICMIFMIFFS